MQTFKTYLFKWKEVYFDQRIIVWVQLLFCSILDQDHNQKDPINSEYMENLKGDANLVACSKTYKSHFGIACLVLNFI
jgi:hypothetical protein